MSLNLEDILEKTEYRKNYGINSGYFIQHEYGIAGKDHDSEDNVVYLLKKMKEKKISTVTITHTLLSKPSDFKISCNFGGFTINIIRNITFKILKSNIYIFS